MKWCLVFLIILSCLQTAFAQETQPSELPPLQSESKGTPKEVTLQEAVDLALKNNLGLEIERYNPEIVGTDVQFQESAFDPLFVSNVSQENATFPTSSSLQQQGAASVTNKTTVWDFDWKQKLKTSTIYEVAFQNFRQDTNQLFTTVNPEYDSSLFLRVTQPLLRNFGLEITTLPLKRAYIDRLAADYRLQMRTLDIVLSVEQNYWNLVFARKQLLVNQNSYNLAKELYENNKKQVEVGTMAPLDIVVAEAEVAARTQGIITVDALIRDSQDNLKLAVLGNDVSKSWPLEVVPTEEPTLTDVGITEEEALKNAVENSPDLKALQADIDANTLTTKLAANAMKPQLDLAGNWGYRGLGGTTLVLNDDIPPQVIESFPGGYGDSLSNLWKNKTWNVGIVFGLPIRNNAAKSDYVRSDLVQKQSVKIYEQARQQLLVNVRTSFNNLRSNRQRLEAAIASRVLQEKKLDAERKKLAVGLSTNYTVLQFQDDLSQALFQELSALVDYKKEQAQLNRYLGISPYVQMKQQK